ncbi:MAG: hypothetical protein M1837_005706 [Sclerophora amabilis]|nr:MAG: hypothetical protein M1837_005706 [Sclerophora amabilis]
MRQCLTSPEGGYYTSAQNGHDQFGTKGDFITSPEISQIFGELIGVWIVAEWMAQGKRGNGVELIEVGPGRGTLIDDALRTIRNFRSLASSIEAVYLVESSAVLREAQKQRLCGDAPMEETSIGFRSRSTYSDIPVIWCEDIRFVPKGTGKSPFIVAHEFFDALPINVFQSVAPSQLQITTSASSRPPRPSSVPQWRELVVSPTQPFTPLTNLSIPTSQKATETPPEFEMSLSKASTPNSVVLPEISSRYKALKSQAGATIEISPEGQSYAEEFARRIGGTNVGEESKKDPSGAALIIDYGPASTIPVNSLRGIRSHKAVSPFCCPGRVDLSADVDFTALADAALKASPAVEVHGPVEQGYFLQAMGIEERATQLLRNVNSNDDEKRKRLDSGWRRLVERGGGCMGKIYKAMAIVPLTGGQRRPVGFGGDVEA